MAGKRRRPSTAAAGIRRRKRPATANKQTLVRVAEHKEAAARKLRRRLEDAEARELDRTRAALGLRTLTQDSHSQRPRGIPLDRNDGDDDDDDDEQRAHPARIRYLQKCAAGYAALVDGLDVPLFEKQKGESEEEEPRKPQAGELAHQHRHEQETPEKLITTDKPPSSVGGSQPQALSLELENAEAASREKAHFDTDVTPDLPHGQLSLLGTFPVVGRVSATLDAEKRRQLVAALEAGCPRVSERSLGLQPSVHARWSASPHAAARSGKLDRVERAFVSVLRDYYDVLLCRRLSNAQDDRIRRLYVAHCLAHVLRARARVVRNDTAVKKDVDTVDRAKDQGFSRARVLILLPMKNAAYDVVRTLTTLAVEPGPNVQNSERFESEFAPVSGEESDADEEAAIEGTGNTRKGRRKPDDYRRIFRGNIEDDFKLGISFAKKSMRLYADFHSSDIIIASPLGLRRALAEKASGKTAHERLSQKNKEKDENTEWKTGIGAPRQEPKQDEADDGFLSSIEICVVDGAHVFSMQNWDTLRKAVGMMNKMPSNTRDTDFSRVRGWCLDGLMKRFRQTVVLARYRKSEFVSLMREGANHAGRVQLLESPAELGTMANVVVSMRQTFFKVPDVDSPASSVEKRFSFFFSHTFPLVRCLLDAQTLLVVPSYFDYVRVRNKLLSVADDDANFRFASMCEYSKGADISRARAKLHDRSVALVLMTERFHFFWRHWLRGADVVVWYGLPENAEYFAEINNMMGEEADKGKQVQAFALYDELDAFRLERVVGRKRCRKMIAKDSKSTYLFV